MAEDQVLRANSHNNSTELSPVYQRATNLLGACLEQHSDCRKGRESYGSTPSRPEKLQETDIPTRLLHISKANEQVHLIELSDLTPDERASICTQGFVSLSYCWGMDQPVKLLKNTLATFKQGLENNALPKTLQDAIWVTTMLGLNYIWIDCLCIVQDDSTDKQKEVSRMSIYYSVNTITICAASASTCMVGFLKGQDEQRFEAGPFKFDLTGENDSILLYEEAKVTELEPTARRAWTLQESLLSRRLLIFTSKHLYWCCHTSNADCNQPYAEHVNRVLGYPASLVPNIFPLEVLETMPILVQWRTIICDYMKRGLGFGEDKLLAISAMALVMHPSFQKQRQGRAHYMGGIWINQDHFESTAKELEWMVDSSSSKRIAPYTAPSWSWACMEGSLAHVTRIHEQAYRSRLLDHHIELSVPSAPYGAVKSGYLIIRGPLRSPDASIGFPRRVIPGHFSSFDDDIENAKELYMRLCPDTEEDRLLMEDGIETKGRIYCLELTPYSLKGPSPSGLVLVQCANVEPETYRRIGVFSVCRDKVNYEEPEERRRAREACFEDDMMQDVRLV